MILPKATLKEFTVAVAMVSCGAAALVLVAILGHGSLPPTGVLVGFTLFTLLTLLLAFPAPRIGWVSLDRVSLIAVLLVFGPFTAAVVLAIANFVWPFLGRHENGLAFRRSATRAFMNSGMLAMVTLAGGAAYVALGGELPLADPNFSDVIALMGMAATLQLTNNILMGVVSLARDDPFWRAWSFFVNVMELAMLPLGVLTALAYNWLPTAAFVLLCVVLVLLALLMRSFALNRDALEKRIRQMQAINRLSEAVNASTSLDTVAERVYEQCRELLNFSSFLLALHDPAVRELEFILHHSRGKRMPTRRVADDQGLTGWLIRNNKPILIEDWERDRSGLKQRMVIRGDPPAAWLGVPVTYRGRILGAISVQNFQRKTLKKADLEPMIAFADQVGAAISNAQLFVKLQNYERDLERKVAERTHSLKKANSEKEHLLARLRDKADALDRLSKEDGLTGLYNRRHMDERLAAEMKRARRFEHESSIAMADLDYFKQINDTYSHGVGDEVLRITAQILRESCRPIDIISRYGGEEFVIYFPETDTDGGRVVCQRIWQKMRDYDWDALQPGLSVTVSIGVAGGRYDWRRLLQQADERLYEAKGAGRDRVCPLAVLNDEA